jgi:hypothetical protein
MHPPTCHQSYVFYPPAEILARSRINGLPLPVSNPEIRRTVVHPPVLPHSLSLPNPTGQGVQAPVAYNSPSPSLLSTPGFVASNGSQRSFHSIPSTSTQGGNLRSRPPVANTQVAKRPSPPSSAIPSPAHHLLPSIHSHISTNDTYPRAVSTSPGDRRHRSQPAVKPQGKENLRTKFLNTLLCR